MPNTGICLRDETCCFNQQGGFYCCPEDYCCNNANSTCIGPYCVNNCEQVWNPNTCSCVDRDNGCDLKTHIQCGNGCCPGFVCLGCDPVTNNPICPVLE